MVKIGIATITAKKTNTYNYGNILQNYALTKFLQKNGYNVKTIYYTSTTPHFTYEVRAKEKRRVNVIQVLDDIIRIINRKLNKSILIQKKEHRDNGFIQFINDNIEYSKYEYDINSDYTSLNDEFDFFITGSDQVWNPYYDGSNEFFYLTFAERKKRITFSPSIGVDHIPDMMKNKMKNWLNGFENISIREESGQKLLQKEFGINSTLTCDPVFLLDKTEWSILAGDPILKEKYFAVYTLGKKTVETKRQINKLSKKYKIKSIDIYTRDNPNSFFCDPIEFINIIKNSEFVVTDSFHGTAFSLIFNKPIIIIDRNASVKTTTYVMSNRIDNILNIAGLKNRTIEKILSGSEPLIAKVDTNNSELITLINKSKQYLLDRIDEINEENVVL